MLYEDMQRTGDGFAENSREKRRWYRWGTREGIALLKRQNRKQKDCGRFVNNEPTCRTVMMRPTVALLSALVFAASLTLHAAPESNYLIGTGDIHNFIVAACIAKRLLV